MLAASHRLTESEHFAEAVRGGRRAGGRTVVIHFKQRESGEPALVGFVVSKSVGNAVARNRVKRRLRALVQEHVSDLPRGSLLVVRALPASAEADFGALRSDVARSFQRLSLDAA